MEIAGTITANATVTKVKGNKEVVNFNLALNETYKDKQGTHQERVQFIRCSYWIGSTVAKILTKGTGVCVSGWMTPSAWKDDKGELQAGLNLRVDHIQLVGKVARELESSPVGTKVETEEAPADDLPF